MGKKYSMRNILIAAIIAVFSISVSQSQTKVGVVDFVKVAEQLPEAMEFDKKIKDLQLKYSDTVRMRNQALIAKQEELQKQAAMMTDEMKQQKAMELQAEYAEIQRYQQEKLGNQGELIMMQNEFMIPFREKIVNAVAEVAKKEKINIVIDKNQALYSDDSLEITFTVIDRLKRGAN